MSTIKIVSN